MRDNEHARTGTEQTGGALAIRRLLEQSNRRAMDLEQTLLEGNRDNEALRRTIDERDERIRALEATVAEFESRYGRASGSGRHGLRSWADRWARRLYRLIPIPISVKMRVKGLIFQTFAPLLQHTRGYQAWREFEGRAGADVDAVMDTRLQPAESPPDTGEAGEVSRVLPISLPCAEAARWAPPLLPEQVRAAPEQLRILMIDEWIPTPDRSSGSFRLLEILKALREIGCHVELAIHHGRALHESMSIDASDLARYEQAVSGLSIALHFGQEAILEHLAAEGQGYSHVWLSFPSIVREYLPWVRARAFHARLLFDSIDLHHVRFARQAELTGDPEPARQGEFYRRLERVCCQSADVTIAITEEERRQLLVLSPKSRVVLIPNIHRVASTIAPLAGRGNLLFIGGFRHQPNVDAVHYFVEEIFPRVRSRLPEAEFVIIGSNMPAAIASLTVPGVRAVGYVEDPEPYFQAARVFVAPLRYGAGMKGKVGQALSVGLPAVATPIAAEGMDLVDERQILMAQSPAEFAEAVFRLYTDDALWRRLSEQGLKHIERHFSPTALRVRLERVLGLNQGFAGNDAPT